MLINFNLLLVCVFRFMLLVLKSSVLLQIKWQMIVGREYWIAEMGPYFETS